MSSYDEYLEQLKASHSVTAKECLERLYQLLKLEDPRMSKDDMYDRIMKDCLVIWSHGTIENNMPNDLKDVERQGSGKKGRKKQMISVTNDGSVAHTVWANNDLEQRKEQESRTSDNDGIGRAAATEGGHKTESDEHENQIQTNQQQQQPRRETEPATTDSRIIAHPTLKDSGTSLHESNSELSYYKEAKLELEHRIERLEDDMSHNYVHIDIYNAAQQSIEDLKATVIARAQHIKELEEIIANGMKVEFNSASNLVPAAFAEMPTEARPNKVEFPANLFGKFFIATRNIKQSLSLSIGSDGKVEGWE